MKKIFALVLTVVIAFSALTAGASSVPKFMEKSYNNYTADYKVSMTIDNADEIVAFLDEVKMPDEINNYIDVKALLESLCTVNSEMRVEAEMSEDFRKMKVALTAESAQDIKFNRNLDTSYSMRMGMWMDMDIDAKKLVIIYSTPLNEKYAVLDFAKDLPSEVTEPVFEMYDKMFNREFMEKTSKEIMALSMEHADISMDGSRCVVMFDNDAFVSVAEDIAEYVFKMASDMAVSAGEEPLPEMEIPSFKGIKLLGDDGIVCTYKLNGNKIKSVSEKIDISIGLAGIYTMITGEEWSYNFDGNIDFTLISDAVVSKVGTTHPAMPEITAENSFSYTERLGLTAEPDYGYEYDGGKFRSLYTYGSMEFDTFDGERYYMPLRATIEDAYWECADITYDNGFVTIKTYSDTAEENIDAAFRVGEDKAMVNGVNYEGFGAFKLIDGSVYASADFYEECLGWTLDYLWKDLLEGGLDYEFCTEKYDFEF